jgi:hypothetical protein
MVGGQPILSPEEAHMNMSDQIEKLREEFHPALMQFLSLACELGDETADKAEHGQIEVLVSKMGNEVLRRLLQGHYDLRCNTEERRESVTGSDGVVRTHCRCGCERDLMTIFGQVTVKRKGYKAPGVESVFPMDGELNLPLDKYSHPLRHRVAEEVASHSFDEAAGNIEKNTGGKTPKRQTEEVVVRAAQDFEEFYSGRESEGPEPTSDILVMTVDQKGVVMRKEDLRPETRKAAEKQSERPAGTRLSPGEKLNRKRMATVASVYSNKALERTPEMIMGLSPDEEKSKRPRCENKRVWASLEQEPEEVIQAMFDEALRRDPEKKRPWAVLLDGGEKQLDIVLARVLSLRPEATVVLDFIHVLEYVWKAAHGFYAVGSKEAQAWVGEQALKILRGESASVVNGLRQSIDANKLAAEKRKAADKCSNYLEKYEPLLHYDDFLKQGLPIATGVIEGACRHLIKDRMDITGARWRLQRAEAVLRIRSLRSSGDLDAYWKFHQAQERKRNHSYADPCAI